MAKSFSIKQGGEKKVAPKISGLENAFAGLTVLSQKNIKNRELRLIPLDQIKAKEQVRTGIAEESFKEKIKELAASLQKDGMLQPILLAKRDPADNKYIIFDGETRYRAFQLLGKESIPAILTDMEYAESSEWQLKQVAANLMRNALTPWELGRSFYRAIQQGVSVTDLAEQFGKSRGYVQNYLAIYRAPEELQKYFADKELRDVVTMTTLVRSSELDAESFKNLFAPYLTAEESISRADAKNIQKTIEAKKQAAETPDTSEPAAEDAEETEDVKSKGTKTKEKAKPSKKTKTRWQLEQGCRELPDLRGMCFRAVLQQEQEEGTVYLHGTLMSNVETDQSGKVVFLYEGKAFAVDPSNILKIEGVVSADKIVTSEDYKEEPKK